MKFSGLSIVVSGECSYERPGPVKSRGHAKPPCWGGLGYHPVLRTGRENSANQASGCGHPGSPAVARGCRRAVQDEALPCRAISSAPGGGTLRRSWTGRSCPEQSVSWCEVLQPETYRKRKCEPLTIDQAALRRRFGNSERFGPAIAISRAESRSAWVRPVIMAFYRPVWLLAGWCEYREGFRIFRLDRMSAS